MYARYRIKNRRIWGRGRGDKVIEVVVKKGDGERKHEIIYDARGTASCTVRRTEIESGRPTSPLT